MSEWQDISTAPRDMTNILVWDGESISIVFWGFELGEGPYDLFPWVKPDLSEALREDIVTHWMPLPPPPLPTHSEEA